MATRIAVWGIGVAAVSAGGFAVWSNAAQREKIDLQTANLRDAFDRREGVVRERARVRKSLSAFAATTLGPNEEQVGAALRTNLNQILQACGLGDISVSASHPREIASPAAAAKAEEYKDRSVNRRPDFLAVTARAQGTGSLDEAVRTLATVRAQTWTHRVEGFTLEPIGQDRSSVKFTVMVTTIYLPDSSSQWPENEPPWQPIAEADFAPWRRIVDKNIFAPPRAIASADGVSPPTQPSREVQLTLPEDPGMGYGEWRLTGIVRGSSGPQLWLQNERTRQIVTLAVGEGVMNSVFVETDEVERARIRIGEELFDVDLGQTLADRRPVSK